MCVQWKNNEIQSFWLHWYRWCFDTANSYSARYPRGLYERIFHFHQAFVGAIFHSILEHTVRVCLLVLYRVASLVASRNSNVLLGVFHGRMSSYMIYNISLSHHHHHLHHTEQNRSNFTCSPAICGALPSQLSHRIQVHHRHRWKCRRRQRRGRRTPYLPTERNGAKHFPYNNVLCVCLHFHSSLNNDKICIVDGNHISPVTRIDCVWSPPPPPSYVRYRINHVRSNIPTIFNIVVTVKRLVTENTLSNAPPELKWMKLLESAQ